MSVSHLGNIQISQYGRFETMFQSEQSEEIKTLLENVPKSQVVAILDSYGEMVQEVNPDIIKVADCIKLAIENGVLETDIYDISNMYRELAAVVIETVEGELYDLLPEPEANEDVPDNVSLSKINGETYYNLEDALTSVFKNSSF